MQARLDLLIPTSCCVNRQPDDILGCCARYFAAFDDAPAVAAEIADLTERALEFLLRKFHSALQAVSAAVNQSGEGAAGSR